MTVLSTLTAVPNLSQIWKYENSGRAVRPTILELGESLLVEAQSLITPKVVLDLFQVNRVLHNRIELAAGYRLQGSKVARLLAPAKEIAVAIVTLGPALEKRVSRYFADNQPLCGYLLDRLGTTAVTSLQQQVCAHLEGLAQEKAWQVGFPISPGDNDWPLVEQKILFELVPAHTIGVRLTRDCIMVPKMSLSFVSGLGPQIQDAAGALPCDFCSIRASCRYRQGSD